MNFKIFLLLMLSIILFFAAVAVDAGIIAVPLLFCMIFLSLHTRKA